MPIIIYRFSGKVSYVTGVILLDGNLENKIAATGLLKLVSCGFSEQSQFLSLSQ